MTQDFRLIYADDAVLTGKRTAQAIRGPSGKR